MEFSSLISNERGFLPTINLTNQLPEVSRLNIQLNHLVENLPTLLLARSLRTELEKLNQQHTDTIINIDFADKQHQYAALLMLLMLAQAYIWENADEPCTVIPTVIAKNIYSLCKTLQRFPVLTYADYVLHNWRLKNNCNGINLDNIEPLVTFTGTSDEAWFIKIHVAIEAICGKALHAAYQALELANKIKLNNTRITTEYEKQLGDFLHIIAETLHEARLILNRMREGCDPSYYWKTLRHYLNGWEKIKSADQEFTGIRFEGIVIHGKVPAYTYKGASGAQSSIIPAIDAVLGINHDIDDMYQTLLTFQHYMPSEHVLFIHILNQGQIKQVIDSSISSFLTERWKIAVNNLRLFRLGHLQLVQQYIYQPSENEGFNAKKITGTGGTPISEYLGNRYENTLT